MAVAQITGDLDEEVDAAVAATPAPTQVASADAPPPVTPAAGPSSIDDLIVTPANQRAIQDRLLTIKRNQAAASSAGADQTIQQLRADKTEVNQAFKATALDPNDLQPWDQKAKQNEYRTDPVEAFGSIGSVFGLLAASFAGLPMEYALNAGAAAINAVHAGDEKAYTRDFEAWKTNTDLALKRHNIMRQHYNDAILKMNTNLNAGRSEMEMAARKFGDQTAIAMLESGLDKELNELVNARNKSALELQSTADQVWLQHEKTMDLKSSPGWMSGNPALKAQAVQEWQERWRAGGKSQLSYDATKDYVDTQKKANPDYTPEDLLRWQGEATEANTKGKPPTTPQLQAAEVERRSKKYVADGMSEEEAFDRATREIKSASTATRQLPFDSEKEFMDAKKKEKPDYSAADFATWKREWSEAETAKAGGTGPEKLTGPQEKARRIKSYEDEIRAADPSLSASQVYEQATSKYNQANLSISGNRSDDLRKQIAMFDNGISGIDKAMKVLDNYTGAAGAAGYATRAAERVGNIFGSNKTDRTQFAHEIEYLQSIAPRLLQDASSRGLKAEADKINRIIAGLNLGDTTANTKRALMEVRELWTKMQNDNRARLREPVTTVPGPGQSKPAPGKSGPAWMQAPVVGPRSSLDGAQYASRDPEPTGQRLRDEFLGRGQDEYSAPTTTVPEELDVFPDDRYREPPPPSQFRNRRTA